MTETQWIIRELEAAGLPDEQVKTARELLYRVRMGACSRTAAESLIDDMVRRRTAHNSLKEVLEGGEARAPSSAPVDIGRKDRKRLIAKTKPRRRLNPAVFVVMAAWALAVLCGLGAWKAWELVMWWKGGAA